MSEQRIVTARKSINAPSQEIFDWIADPAKQPEWDGNDNLKFSSSPRVRSVGDVFRTELTNGQGRDNEVIEFEEARRIAWKPAPVGEEARGHIWGWELNSVDENTTDVTHFFDWTQLTDETRFERARQNTEEALMNSVNRLEKVVTGN